MKFKYQKKSGNTKDLCKIFIFDGEKLENIKRQKIFRKYNKYCIFMVSCTTKPESVLKKHNFNNYKATITNTKNATKKQKNCGLKNVRHLCY